MWLVPVPFVNTYIRLLLTDLDSLQGRPFAVWAKEQDLAILRRIGRLKYLFEGLILDTLILGYPKDDSGFFVRNGSIASKG